MQVYRTGQLVISINAATGTSAAELEQLARIHQRYDIPATWALPEPARAVEIGALVTSSVKHEVALLANHDWANCGRTRFARELVRRMADARAHGISVSTMALDRPYPMDHIDLLVKHRISMIRSAEVDSRQRDVRPKSVRFGVWQSAPAYQVSQPTPWRGHRALWFIKRAIKRSALTGELIHVMIDTAHLAQNGAHEGKRIGSILALAASQRQKRGLRISTLAELVSRQRRTRSSKPNRSILRAA